MGSAKNSQIPEGLIPPAYGAHSLVAVMPAVLGAFGINGNTATRLNYAKCATALNMPKANNIVVVLCDGLGYVNLANNRAYAPYLRSRFSEIMPLTTVFPATTAAALSSFGTGTAPGRTGLVGYTVRVPDYITEQHRQMITAQRRQGAALVGNATDSAVDPIPGSAAGTAAAAAPGSAAAPGASGTLANLVSWTQQYDPTVIATESGNQGAPAFEVPPEEFQREPALLKVMADNGVSVLSAGAGKFAGSGLTKAAFHAGQFRASETLSGRVNDIISFIRKSENKPKCAYLYWGDVDKKGHGFGPDSAEWAEALSLFDHEFERLIGGLPSGTLVILTADHGQIPVDFANQIDVAKVPALAEGVALVAGEPRALHLYANGTNNAAKIADRWRTELGDRALVWLQDEAIAQGLFGSVSPHVKPWIGDVVVAPMGTTTIVDSRTQTAHSLELKGAHGALTPTEMQVPFLLTIT